MESPEWISRSLCKNRHVDLWYPPLDSDQPEKYYSVAREVCRRCPVWRNCLESGITETWGMWGGLTPLERTALSKDKAPKPTSFKAHGTWVRYRQGCDCDECIEAHSKPIEQMDISMVPFMNDKLDDLDTLKFLLSE